MLRKSVDGCLRLFPVLLLYYDRCPKLSTGTSKVSVISIFLTSVNDVCPGSANLAQQVVLKNHCTHYAINT